MTTRCGISMLEPIGLDGFIAHSPNEYIERAKYWAAHPAELNDIRQALREKLKASPLMDAPAFAANMEKQFRQFWREWCKQGISQQ